MNRILLILMLLCISYFLLAQDSPVSPLDLGDVIIEGESDLIKDSLGTNYDLDSLLKVEDKDKFLYKPEPVLETVSNKNIYDNSNLLSLEAKGGNNKFASLKAALSASQLLNFNLNLYNRSLADDWSVFTGNMNWLPSWKKTNFNLGIEYLDFKSPQVDTEAQDISLGIALPGLTLTEKLTLPAVSLSALYYQITQSEVDFSSIDIRSNISWDISRLALISNLDYLKEHFQTDLTIYIKDLPVNRLGLYMHYRPEFLGESGKFTISVDFFNQIKLHQSLFLNISNEPYLTKNSYLDDLKAYKYQQFTDNSNQYSALLNPELSLEYFGPVYLKGSYKFSIQDDQYLFVPDTTGLFKIINYNRVDKQEAGLNLVYKYEFLEINNKFTYTKYEVNSRISVAEFTEYEMNIPYVPELENLFSLGINYSRWTFKAEDNFISGREDELGDEMQDLNLINLSLAYKLSDQFEVLGEAENILAEKYRTASYLPEECVQFKAGFRWSY
jgi:hypothetical protein